MNSYTPQKGDRRIVGSLFANRHSYDPIVGLEVEVVGPHHALPNAWYVRKVSKDGFMRSGHWYVIKDDLLDITNKMGLRKLKEELEV